MAVFIDKLTGRPIAIDAATTGTGSSITPETSHRVYFKLPAKYWGVNAADGDGKTWDTAYFWTRENYEKVPLDSVCCLPISNTAFEIDWICTKAKIKGGFRPGTEIQGQTKDNTEVILYANMTGHCEIIADYISLTVCDHLVNLTCHLTNSIINVINTNVYCGTYRNCEFRGSEDLCISASATYITSSNPRIKLAPSVENVISHVNIHEALDVTFFGPVCNILHVHVFGNSPNRTKVNIDGHGDVKYALMENCDIMFSGQTGGCHLSTIRNSRIQLPVAYNLLENNVLENNTYVKTDFLLLSIDDLSTLNDSNIITGEISCLINVVGDQTLLRIIPQTGCTIKYICSTNESSPANPSHVLLPASSNTNMCLYVPFETTISFAGCILLLIEQSCLFSDTVNTTTLYKVEKVKIE